MVETIADGAGSSHRPASRSCAHTAAEAPAKVLAEHGNALADELAARGIPAHEMGGLATESRVSNSARKYRKVVHRFGFALRVPISQVTHCEGGQTVNMPFLRPSDFLQTLLETNPWILLGGLMPGEEACQVLQTFWSCYRMGHGSHEVFNQPESRLRWTIPIALHGDGGRTLKKQPVEIVSIEAIIGLNSHLCEDVSCRCSGAHRKRTLNGDFKNPLAQQLNQKHNSYLSRFLLFAFASKKYKLQPSLLKVLLQHVSENLGQTCNSGLSAQGHTFYFAVVGYKGDLEYHAKTGLLTRSYKNVGHVNPIACCHECDGGVAGLPFEDMSPTAKWIDTRYGAFPWNETPPFSSIPFEDWTAGSGKASLFFRRDPFHIFRLGIARNFIGSVIIMYCGMGKFNNPGNRSKDIKIRLELAWAHFELWFDTHGTAPGGIRSFSKDKLHYTTANSFPWIGCKGSDTIILLKWLQFFTQFLLRHETDQEHSNTERIILDGVQAGLKWSQSMHRHSVWLPPACAKQLLASAHAFCASYARLADISLRSKLTLFSMVPKIHSMLHFIADLRDALEQRSPYIANPATFDCSMNEDFIGRIARQSRRISIRNAERSVLQAYLCKLKFVIKRYRQTLRAP